MFEKLTQLEALLSSMSGGAGVSELSQTQIQAMVNMAQGLAFDALAECPTAD